MWVSSTRHRQLADNLSVKVPSLEHLTANEFVFGLTDSKGGDLRMPLRTTLCENGTNPNTALSGRILFMLFLLFWRIFPSAYHYRASRSRLSDQG